MQSALNTIMAYFYVIWSLFGWMWFETNSLTHWINVNKGHVVSRVLDETIQKRSPSKSSLWMLPLNLLLLQTVSNCSYLPPLPLKQSRLQRKQQGIFVTWSTSAQRISKRTHPQEQTIAQVSGTDNCASQLPLPGRSTVWWAHQNKRTCCRLPNCAYLAAESDSMLVQDCNWANSKDKY